MIVLISAIAYFLHPAIGTIASTLSLVIGVLLVGASQGLIPGLVAATAAFLFFNFFMADPILTLRLESGEDLAPLIAFNVTADCRRLGWQAPRQGGGRRTRHGMVSIAHRGWQ